MEVVDMKRFLMCVFLTAIVCGSAYAAEISGEMKKWHTVTITFDGPQTSEANSPNPFTDYRLDVTFVSGDREIVVPGYYAADGDAGNTHAESGNKWNVHFTPDETGRWEYTASFHKGKNVATAKSRDGFDECSFHGESGRFVVEESDKTGRDFRSQGRLDYVGKRYLRFAGSEKYFIKGGADSPENILGYSDFDNTYFVGGGEGFVHDFSPHVGDWTDGDPTFARGKGKGIIGAINYLADQGMNSVYFMTYNIDGGDGKDVWMWTSPDVKDRYDCSKLAQWEVVFSHMQKRGIMLHVVTQETENDQGIDGGALGNTRKLYYREIVSRFAHHPALVWNLGEENSNTDAERKAFAKYIRELDPYDHPVVCHTGPGHQKEGVYNDLLGYKYFDGPSLQLSTNEDAYSVTKKWVTESAKAGRQWFVSLDESGGADKGVAPDSVDPGHDKIRKNMLWANLMAGGAGCEWYFGYSYPHHDLTCEDWRTRENMWEQTRHALEFFNVHLQNPGFWKMEPVGGLVTSGTTDYTLAAPGECWAIYVHSAENVSLDMKDYGGEFEVVWFDPRRGGKLQAGDVKTVKGPGKVALGRPPHDAGLDWAVIVRRVER